MKVRNLIALVVFLTVSAGANDLQAQKHLDALMKKCESMNDLKIEVISRKDPVTKKPKSDMLTVTLDMETHAKLIEEFREAFAKDKDDAYSVIENKMNGKVIPSLYRFSENGTTISYDWEESASMKRIWNKVTAEGVLNGELNDGVQITRTIRYKTEGN